MSRRKLDTHRLSGQRGNVLPYDVASISRNQERKAEAKRASDSLVKAIERKMKAELSAK